MELLDPVLKFIGLIVAAGGGLSLIVFYVFKYLGEKWLDSKFGERLQALKLEQEKELERYSAESLQRFMTLSGTLWYNVR